jgi:hypothetical protein
LTGFAAAKPVPVSRLRGGCTPDTACEATLLVIVVFPFLALRG